MKLVFAFKELLETVCNKFRITLTVLKFFLIIKPYINSMYIYLGSTYYCFKLGP